MPKASMRGMSSMAAYDGNWTRHISVISWSLGEHANRCTPSSLGFKTCMSQNLDLQLSKRPNVSRDVSAKHKFLKSNKL